MDVDVYMSIGLGFDLFDRRVIIDYICEYIILYIGILMLYTI